MEPFQDTGMMFPHFSILTREPGNDIRPIHDRMPVILDAQDAAAWIRPGTNMDEMKQITARALTGMMFERVE
ncbi:MAG: SOS response-associated peptidase family protein [Oscillospiraceae bacterium]|nr:SOS response-associated peptidase family protein [Oscillospiraceae bacterium]